MKTALQYALKVGADDAAAPIRVMLVDDSAVVRSIFARILSANANLKLIFEAADGEAAINALDHIQPDIILLDIEMPHRSGLDVLPELLLKGKGARVLVVSALAEENGPAAVRALALGACDTLAKPGRVGFAGTFAQTLVEKVTRLGRASEVVATDSALPKVMTDVELVRPSCIAIGSSTGGIPAINTIIGRLDPGLDCPIFITQHLPPAFMAFFAKQLQSLTSRVVTAASAGMPVRKNHIYVAPGEAHLVCARVGGKIVLDCPEKYPSSHYCPSVDAMFASIASIYGDKALSIVLSGMGNDGSVGAIALRQSNAAIIVQDSHSSVVWGMPGNVARQGIANAILDPDQIARFLEFVARQ